MQFHRIVSHPTSLLWLGPNEGETQPAGLLNNVDEKDSRKSVTMTTKGGLITDSFKVVKKAGNRAKREIRPSASPAHKEPETAEVQEEEELQRLRQFDLDWRFGPCTGISRLQRWERAKVHGLSPPEEIRDLLLQTHAKYNLSLWSLYPL
ncbi:DNA polymerase delta subunit 4 [Spinachia spinachia]